MTDLEDEDDLPKFDGSTLHYDTPAIATLGASGVQRAARGTLLWDADDPLAISFYMEIALGSRALDEANFPTLPASQAMCLKCQDDMARGEMVVPVQVAGVLQLWCLMCASDTPDIRLEEALWVFGLQEMNDALMNPDHVAAPVTSSGVRMWMGPDELLVFSFVNGPSAMFLNVPSERVRTLLEYIDIQRGLNAVDESYLEGGLAQLETLANEE